MIFVGLYGFVAIVCLLSRNGKNRRSRIIACILIFLAMQLLIGLRHIQYGGVDTRIYARDFMRIVNQNYSFFDIFNVFYKDFGFYLFAKIFSLFSSDMNAWLFVCALPYTIGVTWLIYKYSNNMFLSFIMFLSFGYYLYNFQLVRHVFALGLIVLAYKYLEEEHYKKFFATVLVASFCHTIAILFLGAYFVRKGRVTVKQVIWILVGGFAVLVLSQQSVLAAVFSLVPFLSEGRFSQYLFRGGNFSSEFIIQLLFVVISWIYLYGKKDSSVMIVQNGQNESKKIKKKKFELNFSNSVFIPARQNNTLLFNMSVIATLFYLMTIAIGESYRMAQYFSLFTIILVPKAISMEKNTYVRLIITLAIVAFGIWHFFGGLFVDGSVYNPYVFFWEIPQNLY